MHKQFEINRTKGGCQSGREVVTHNSKSDLRLKLHIYFIKVVQMGFQFEKIINIANPLFAILYSLLELSLSSSLSAL